MASRSLMIACGCAVTIFSLKIIQNCLKHRSLQLKCKKQREKRQESIEIIKNQLNQTAKFIRNKIQKLSYTDLKEALENGKYSARQVLHAFQEMAIKAHERTNCVSEFILEADAWAQALDTDNEHRQLPLFALPFSVKESLWVKGYLSTRGVVGQLDGPEAPFTNIVVQTLQDAGAIPFVRTNVPQTLFSYGCANPIYGRTTNPFNNKRTSGGSSGGAVFGIGTDLGGSIRLPAHSSGCCGLKPTADRLSQVYEPFFQTWNLFVGCAGQYHGRALIGATNGPLAACVLCLQQVMQVLCAHNQMHKRDCTVPPIPWNIAPPADSFKIGWFSTSEYMPCTPSVQNAVEKTMQKLSAWGCQLVPFMLPDLEKVFGWCLTTSLTDQGRTMGEELSSDILNVDDTKFQQRLLFMNRTYRHLCLMLSNNRRSLQMFNDIPTSTYELRKVYCAVREYRAKVLDEWRCLQLNALLCPPCASVAMLPELAMQTVPAHVYTAVFNILNLPAGVVHVGHVTKEDSMAHTRDYPAIDVIDRNMHLCNGTNESIGLPIAVQVVALPYQEETCLQVMGLLEECKQCPVIE